MRSSALIVTASLVACMPTAHAQEFVPPRFEGLEQQQLNLEQRQYDRLEERLQSEQFRAAQPGAFPASSALRRMEIEREARELAVVLGESSLTESDKAHLVFADRFENEFINQSADVERSLETSLDLGWELLKILPRDSLKRVKIEMVDKYMGPAMQSDAS
mgnify:CR=1 FL=1